MPLSHPQAGRSKTKVTAVRWQRGRDQPPGPALGLGPPLCLLEASTLLGSLSRSCSHQGVCEPH